MEPFRAQSTSEQLSTYLKRQILAGVFDDSLPGINQLVTMLGVNSRAVEAAVRRLESEGLLEARGVGKSRRINTSRSRERTKALRIRVLLYERTNRGLFYIIELLSKLREAGFVADFADKSLMELGMNVGRVSRFVAAKPADAWIVCGGSREILQWFSEQAFPAFAMFGVSSGLPIAGTSVRKSPAMVEAVGRLISLGHRRIVMLCREDRRKPEPALYEREFLAELKRHGLATGPYNLPDWEETAEGLRVLLHSLFAHTPPTAIIIDGPSLYHATSQFLGRRGYYAPEKISLICNDPDPGFNWCHPAVTHMSWDHQALVRRALRWTHLISRDEIDRSQRPVDAKFFEGGTIGPAPK